jgi:hypothetical protein
LALQSGIRKVTGFRSLISDTSSQAGAPKGAMESSTDLTAAAATGFEDRCGAVPLYN